MARFPVHGNRCGSCSRVRRLNAVGRGNVYDAPALLDTQYDITFATWGLIIWLPNICRWAKVVADPPALGVDCISPKCTRRYCRSKKSVANWWRCKVCRRWHRRLCYDDITTYAGDSTTLIHTRSYEWCHPMSEIISGPLEAGLNLDFLHEHERLPRRFPMMV